MGEDNEPSLERRCGLAEVRLKVVVHGRRVDDTVSNLPVARVYSQVSVYIAGRSGQDGPKVLPSAAVQMMGVKPIWSEM